MSSLLSLVSGIRETMRAARENDDQFVIFGLRDQRETTRATRENDDQFVIIGFRDQRDDEGSQRK